MKRTIVFLAVLTALTGLVSYLVTHLGRQDSLASISSNSAADGSTNDLLLTNSLGAKKPRRAPTEPQSASAASNQGAISSATSSMDEIAFAAAIDTIVSPHATYEEKQGAWKQLKDSGRLADAAAELEQRTKNDPSYAQLGDPEKAQYQAALGQAYLKMCATSTDMRSQGIWAMTADKDFENALNLDPSNWDARFTKTVAMSYWPDSLNKGNEVIQQFNTLITQQEQQTPQEQFAQTYEWLGKQYQKAGQIDSAQGIWQRGASLYPGDQSLQNLLAAPVAPQQ